MSELISIEGVSKRYRLGVINRGMLYKDLQSWWARKRGKDDPHALITEKHHHDRIENKNEFWALRDINFSISQGETLGVIGKNGAGKSTLLKILSRTTSPTEGQIKTRGRISSLLEVGTGFHPELTGRENVFLNGAILGMRKKEVRAKFDEIVAFAEINEFIDTPVKRYSSGMYVRLAFAVAAHLDPEVLIVDEVLAVGDSNFQRKCIGKMSKVASDGKTVILVSHSMVMVENLTKKCLWLHDGQARMSGPSAEVAPAYLKFSQEQELGAKEGLHDYRLRRGNGSARLTAFTMQNEKGENSYEIERGKALNCAFDITVFKDCRELSIFISFKLGLSGEHTLRTMKQRLNDGPVKAGEVYSGTLSIDTTHLGVSMYDLYIWIGPEVDEVFDEYYDIIDGALTPVKIFEDEKNLHNGHSVLPASVKGLSCSLKNVTVG